MNMGGKRKTQVNSNELQMFRRTETQMLFLLPPPKKNPLLKFILKHRWKNKYFFKSCKYILRLLNTSF